MISFTNKLKGQIVAETHLTELRVYTLNHYIIIISSPKGCFWLSASGSMKTILDDGGKTVNQRKSGLCHNAYTLVGKGNWLHI